MIKFGATVIICKVITFKGKKSLWENGQCLFPSFFSFPPSPLPPHSFFFKYLLLQGLKIQDFVTLLPPCVRWLLTKIFGKGENAGIELFSFSHNVFYCINPFPNKPWFLRVCSISLLKTLWEKEKLLVTSNFSFSHRVFYPFGELSAILITFEIVICKLFEFGRV